MSNTRTSSQSEARVAEPPVPDPDDRLTVFYDGSCPLCRKEINFLRRQRGSDGMVFQDVSGPREGDVAPGLSCDQAMARMHVRLPSGDVKSGAQAFLEMWARLPALRPFVRVLRIPPLPWLLERAYRGFLVLRPRLQRWAGGKS